MCDFFFFFVINRSSVLLNFKTFVTTHAGIPSAEV